MGALISSGSLEYVFSEDSDSNALSLVHDSDGDNPESSGESGPRRQLNNMSRVGFTEAIRTKTVQNMLTAMRPPRKLKLAARVQSKRKQRKFLKPELLRVFYIKLYAYLRSPGLSVINKLCFTTA